MDKRVILISSSCKITQGKYRSIIIDYERDQLYYIQNQFAELLLTYEGYSIEQIESILDDSESVDNFHYFLDFLISNEIVFFTKSKALYPRRNTKIKETPTLLDNLIIEVDYCYWDKIYEELVMHSIIECNVPDIQLRLNSKIKEPYLSHILRKIEDCGIKYMELVCSINQISSIGYAANLLREIPLLSKIIVFEAEENSHISINNESESEPLTFGDLYLSTQPYSPNETCGIINKHSLDFSGVDSYNLNHKYNGCLYKKASITCTGEIRNCPSFKNNWGNIRTHHLWEIVSSAPFQKVWHIHKDTISVCKDCELRYCCSDCRAHRSTPSDLYSRPVTCKYDIDSGKWKD